MKRILAMVLSVTLCLSVCAFAKETEQFCVLKIPYTESDGFNNRARYADTKEPIPLSDCYDGFVFATVPAEFADRKIELFEVAPITFADEDSTAYEFFVMRELSAYGIIRGNAKGEARPYDPITRAEAVAMVVRFLGIGQQADLKFSDVKECDWFYSAVSSAYRAGIVRGDSNSSFSPDRPVSREEAIVMVARAIDYAGLGNFLAEGQYGNDTTLISPWAEEAYRLLGGHVIYDMEGSECLLVPQKAATRAEVGKLLFDVQRCAQIYPSQNAVTFGLEEMPVIDGSTSTYPFTQSVYGMLFSNGQMHPDRPVSHSKSHASYQRLINGEVDMLFASVYPASDILQMAKENGVELELIPIAHDAMIFFTNSDNPADGLTKEQISRIYVDNAYKNWSEVGGPDAKLYPYCRNNDSGSHAQMERHFLNGNEIHETIRKETTSVSMSNVLTDVMDAKTEEPLGYGLGYSIYYYFRNMDVFYETETYLKLLAIDGVYPTDETIANNTYPLSNNTYIVLRSDTPKDAPARRLAEFMLTEDGQQCVENAGYGRLK